AGLRVVFHKGPGVLAERSVLSSGDVVRFGKAPASDGFASCVAVACSVSRHSRYAAASIRIATLNARCGLLFTGASASCSPRWTIRSSIASALVKRATVVSFIGLSLLARGAQFFSIGHRKGPSTGV